ncbi:MAG: hypothetical protein PHV17_08440 [Candidatus Omnitrophica bacterium]|nr:hypothetical protein [Candidatus Omnitrophota bacterium]
MKRYTLSVVFIVFISIVVSSFIYATQISYLPRNEKIESARWNFRDFEDQDPILLQPLLTVNELQNCAIDNDGLSFRLAQCVDCRGFFPSANETGATCQDCCLGLTKTIYDKLNQEYQDIISSINAGEGIYTASDALERVNKINSLDPKVQLPYNKANRCTEDASLFYSGCDAEDKPFSCDAVQLGGSGHDSEVDDFVDCGYLNTARKDSDTGEFYSDPNDPELSAADTAGYNPTNVPYPTLRGCPVNLSPNSASCVFEAAHDAVPDQWFCTESGDLRPSVPCTPRDGYFFINSNDQNTLFSLDDANPNNDGTTHTDDWYQTRKYFTGDPATDCPAEESSCVQADCPVGSISGACWRYRAAARATQYLAACQSKSMTYDKCRKSVLCCRQNMCVNGSGQSYFNLEIGTDQDIRYPKATRNVALCSSGLCELRFDWDHDPIKAVSPGIAATIRGRTDTYKCCGQLGYSDTVDCPTNFLEANDCTIISSLMLDCLANGTCASTCFREVDTGNNQFMFDFVAKSNESIVIFWHIAGEPFGWDETAGQKHFFNQVRLFEVDNNDNETEVHHSMVQLKDFSQAFSIVAATAVPRGIIQQGKKYRARLFYYMPSHPTNNYNVITNPDDGTVTAFSDLVMVVYEVGFDIIRVRE